jgi:hypothetical protein
MAHIFRMFPKRLKHHRTGNVFVKVEERESKKGTVPTQFKATQLVVALAVWAT